MTQQYAVTTKSSPNKEDNPYLIRPVKKITATRVYLEKPLKPEKYTYYAEYVEKRRVIAIFENYDEAEEVTSRAHNKVVGMINTLNRDISDLQSKRTELVEQRRNEIKEAADETF